MLGAALGKQAFHGLRGGTGDIIVCENRADRLNLSCVW